MYVVVVFQILYYLVLFYFYFYSTSSLVVRQDSYTYIIKYRLATTVRPANNDYSRSVL